MSARYRLRRLIHVALATSMVLGLLHGPSMAYADSVALARQVSPDRAHHHSDAGCPQPSDQSGSGHPEHSTSAMPGCPLANIAAVHPHISIGTACGQGARMTMRTPPQPRSADPLLTDPPPRLSA
jgi:hypothetical protein